MCSGAQNAKSAEVRKGSLGRGMARKRRRKFTASSLFFLKSAGRALLSRILNQKKPSLEKKIPQSGGWLPEIALCM